MQAEHGSLPGSQEDELLWSQQVEVMEMPKQGSLGSQVAGGRCRSSFRKEWSRKKVKLLFHQMFPPRSSYATVPSSPVSECYPHAFSSTARNLWYSPVLCASAGSSSPSRFQFQNAYSVHPVLAISNCCRVDLDAQFWLLSSRFLSFPLSLCVLFRVYHFQLMTMVRLLSLSRL